jgi:TetR/AcrR family transcriptional regulator, cholesterol catabolism regulator
MTSGVEAAAARPAKTGPKAARTNKEASILAEACRLFATNGFAGTSIRDIAEAADISNAALYHFFADKNELFARIFVAVTERLCGFVEARIDANETAAQRLRAFMRGYGQFFEDHTHECVAASLSFRALADSPRRDEAIYWRDRYEGILRAIISQGMESGEFRPGDAALTGRAVLSCLNWLHRWYNPAGRMKPVEIVDGYADIILGGVAAPAKARTS